MKKTVRAVCLVGALMTAAVSLGACAYGGAAAVGDKVVITRNNAFLFGMLRKAYVCNVTASGLSNCSSAESP